MRNLKTLTKISLVAVIAGLSVGCATNGELEKVRQQAQAAQATANDAKQSAESALASVRAAEACCQENREAINRAFGKKQYK